MQTVNKHPNFFIIGAPKCGTTAMSEYLRTHPNVFIPSIKEPVFFSPDILVRPELKTLDEYLALYDGVTAEETIVGDASPQYLFSDVALPKIRNFRPDAKLLVMLRQPTDLVYSYHSELLRSCKELEFDFEKAWELQPLRAAGKSIPGGVLPGILRYQWVGSLGSQVKRLFEIFPERQVHFIVLDDMIKDARSEYLRLLEFLGIPDDGRVEFPKVREGIQFKLPLVAWFPRYMKAKTTVLAGSVRNLFRIQELGVIPVFDRFNTMSNPRPPLRQEFRQYLDDVFRDEVILLEKLIGKDLSAWRK